MSLNVRIKNTRFPSSGLHNMADYRTVGHRKIFRLAEKKRIKLKEVKNFQKIESLKIGKTERSKMRKWYKTCIVTLNLTYHK